MSTSDKPVDTSVWPYRPGRVLPGAGARGACAYPSSPGADGAAGARDAGDAAGAEAPDDALAGGRSDPTGVAEDAGVEDDASAVLLRKRRPRPRRWNELSIARARSDRRRRAAVYGARRRSVVMTTTKTYECAAMVRQQNK